MIHIPDKIRSKIDFVLGHPENVSDRPLEVFDKKIIELLSSLSKNLLSNINIRNYPDVATFAFWCRKSNISKIKKNLSSSYLRTGVGLTYHNSPSNVPVNFAFSLVFGILSGNSSVLRLPSKQTEQSEIILNELSKLLKKPTYTKIKKLINIIKFDYDDEINKFWMLNADARIIWGGDETVKRMRSYECKPRSRELVFPDRYSLCVIKAEKILKLSNSEINKLSENLFNDIYLMNQQACSSPQLVNWIGDEIVIEKAKEIIWKKLLNLANSKITLEPIQYMNKYVDVCKNVILNSNIEKIKKKDNILYNIKLSHFIKDQQFQRGFFGTIHEISIKNLNELSSIIDSRCQTLTYFGFKSDELKKFVIFNNLRGLDRIVPIGKSMDMDIIWDGYDVINQLSRTIDIY